MIPSTEAVRQQHVIITIHVPHYLARTWLSQCCLVLLVLPCWWVLPVPAVGHLVVLLEHLVVLLWVVGALPLGLHMLLLVWGLVLCRVVRSLW